MINTSYVTMNLILKNRIYFALIGSAIIAVASIWRTIAMGNFALAGLFQTFVVLSEGAIALAIIQSQIQNNLVDWATFISILMMAVICLTPFFFLKNL